MTHRLRSTALLGLGALFAGALFAAGAAAQTDPAAPSSSRLTLPVAGDTEFERGQRHWSASGSHFLVLNPDGNLVVARADGGYVWGFDTQPDIDHRRVGRVAWQADGNLAAYDADGGYLWSALTENTDPSARLVLQPNGALQIVSGGRGVLWSSDGNLSAPAPAATGAVPAPATPPAGGAGTPASPPTGSVGRGFPLTAGHTLARGSELASPSGNHVLVLQDIGNLVVARRDGGYVWGFDTIRGLNFQQVDRVAMQPDGNFVALNAAGTVIWRALASNPDPSARLELTSRGGLQLVSDSRGVLWASDGVLLPEGVAGRGFPFTAGQVIPQGVEFASPSGSYVLTFQDSGNLVVASPGGSFRWGLNTLSGVDFRQVRSVRMSNDGNLVALGANGRPIWRALASNPDPAARLELTHDGALQLVSPGRGVLWSSDGILATPISVFRTEAAVRACTPEAGWTRCLEMASPRIIIYGSQRTTDAAMRAVANVYAEMFRQLSPTYPANVFDGFRVYLTNDEPWEEQRTLAPIGTMWQDSFRGGGRVLQGGASNDFLWISEQMICQTGVRTLGSDRTIRTFDQVIHEIAHSMEFRYPALARHHDNGAFSRHPMGREEGPPNAMQAWFGAGGDQGEGYRRQMSSVFASRVLFSCEGYTPIPAR